MVRSSSHQVELDFEPGLSRKFKSLRRCVAETVYRHGLDRCAIAADESPGNFSKALGDREKGDNSSRRFDLDALEATLDETRDYTAIYYLIDKYLRDEDTKRKQAIQALGAVIPEIQRLLKQAGVA